MSQPLCTRGRKAQSGIELATFFAFLMMILIILTFEAANRTGQVQRNRDYLEAEKVGGIAAEQINIAFSVGDGYVAKFYLPYGLTGSNYSLSISTEEQRLEITYGQNYSRSFPLLTANVTRVPKQGENEISNLKGEIILA
ncbi:MAG: hypothetical protein V1835_00760 [Candidatus Micrarchaeota archaeon]